MITGSTHPALPAGYHGMEIHMSRGRGWVWGLVFVPTTMFDPSANIRQHVWVTQSDRRVEPDTSSLSLISVVACKVPVLLSSG